ncbi:MAG: UbiX family flavin prenyltransferase [Thermoanaerobaculales bacterium]|jgi:4-hydroxy-3-polyprenylbenzoate decarboxylase|nr:UbiX family flavin prenyltransferase [Thermoanaerobaculales bacterium]
MSDRSGRPRRIVVGVSGASGVVYAIRLLEVLRTVDDVETHLVLTNAAKRTIQLETSRSVTEVEGLADHNHRVNDIAAAIASGSFVTSAMVVVPCSMKTLSGIANSYADNLLIRAAEVTLKERRRLVLVPRETPLHLGHLRLLVRVAELGAVVLPPMPAFYHLPRSVEEIVDQTVGHILDLIGVEPPEGLLHRWAGPATSTPLDDEGP